jgi:hypothetical protein
MVDVCSDSTISLPASRSLEKREGEKISKYQTYIEKFALPGESQPKFVPFVLTSMGGPAEKARAFLKEIPRASGDAIEKSLLIYKIQLMSTHFNEIAVSKWKESVHSSLAKQTFSKASKKNQSRFRRK